MNVAPNWTLIAGQFRVTVTGMHSSAPRPSAPAAVYRAIAKHSFCTLATASSSGPHVVGVLYAAVDGALYVSTNRDSKKARNVLANPRVAVCIPIRRVPLAPPFLVQFTGVGEFVDVDDTSIAHLLHDRRFKKITGHGELEDPQNRFLRITPDPVVHTYGIAVPLRTVVRDPLHASRSFLREARTPT